MKCGLTLDKARREEDIVLKMEELYKQRKNIARAKLLGILSLLILSSCKSPRLTDRCSDKGHGICPICNFNH